MHTSSHASPLPHPDRTKVAAEAHSENRCKFYAVSVTDFTVYIPVFRQLERGTNMLPQHVLIFSFTAV